MTLYQQNIGYNVESVTRSREYLKRKKHRAEKKEARRLTISIIVSAIILTILVFLGR